MFDRSYYPIEQSSLDSFMSDDYIWIVTDEPIESVPTEGQRGGWGEEVRKRLTGLKEVKLPISQVEANMNQFLQLVGRLFQQVDQQIGTESDMKLDEVELSIEISALLPRNHL